MSIFKWPQKEERFFNEVRGEWQTRMVDDIPTVTETIFNELRGEYQEVTRQLTDAEIVERGLEPSKAKPAKKKAKKKVAKKK